MLQRNFGGHRYPRLAHVADRTGLEMLRALQDRSVQTNMQVYMEFTIVTLLKDGDRVVGALGYSREKGIFYVFEAKAVILATGGGGQAYEITTNSWESTGDGFSLAYHAGAELIDMEFIQFHRPGWYGPRASPASWLPREFAVRVGCCATKKAGDSCSMTSRFTAT